MWKNFFQGNKTRSCSSADVSRKRRFPASREESICFERRAAMKDRERQRANRRLKHKEEGLEKKNIFGVKDMTAYNAVQRIRLGRRAALKLA